MSLEAWLGFRDLWKFCDQKLKKILENSYIPTHKNVLLLNIKLMLSLLNPFLTLFIVVCDALG